MQFKTILTAACMAAVSITACKNDRGDDTHMDTSTVTTTTPAASDHTAAPVVTDSVTNANTATSTDTATLVAGGNKEKAVTVDTRTRKTSRKGRVILASLKPLSIEKMEADKEGVYNRAEIMPSYPGGEDALRKYIENHIEYPEAAIDNNAEGTVKVYFAVDEQGKIYTPTVISSRIGYGLEEEALKVVKQMPKWTPGQIKGKNVKTRFTLPITYQIQ